MTRRGPKPGEQRRKAEEQRQREQQPVPAPVQPPQQLLITGPALTVAQRNNPRYLSGVQLRDLGHQRGLSRGELARLSDERVREQIAYIDYRRISELATA